MTDVYWAIEARFGFSIPESYRHMEQQGWFRLHSADYLWIPEMEWYRPEEILPYQPQPYHKPGFVPFAFDGGGSNWCWWPAEGVVVYTPHDCLLGQVAAPDFLGSIYGRILWYAAFFDADEEQEVRARLLDWAKRLVPYFHASWIASLRTLATAPIIHRLEGRIRSSALLRWEALNERLKRELAFPRLDENFEWMEPDQVT